MLFRLDGPLDRTSTTRRRSLVGRFDSSLERLLHEAECSAKRHLGELLVTQTAPQALESLLLREGDTILVEVTVGFLTTVAWPAEVLSARHLRMRARSLFSSLFLLKPFFSRSTKLYRWLRPLGPSPPFFFSASS